MAGQLNLVSLGPGCADLLPPMAQAALKRSTDFVGYDLYLGWIAHLSAGKEIHALPLTRERDRAALALRLAREGRAVSLVSSGDIGVYAMAPLVFEMLEPGEALDVRLVPGITAAQSCASRLGAPLAHDFATLSLSDLLCPWPWIEERAQSIARADLALVLYNVQSETRREGVYRILDILLEHRPAHTWCGIVRNAHRAEESSEVCTLEELRSRSFDMLTTLVIGTRFTKRTGPYIYAPRGYQGWSDVEPELPTDAVWFFTGTRDGNLLAADALHAGETVVVSVASEFGGAQALRHAPTAHLTVGRRGGEPARRALFLRSRPRAIVDATHPFATAITSQLLRLCGELQLPYLRFERPATSLPQDCPVFDSVLDAAREAIRIGKRVFIATGVNQLPEILRLPGARERDWFARVVPNPESLQKAMDAGIPASRLCAMQGPFSADANRTLWRDWKIDCVLTKDSGPGGGVPEKIEAANALGIPLLMVKRPRLAYPHQTSAPAEVLAWIRSVPAERRPAAPEAQPPTSAPSSQKPY